MTRRSDRTAMLRRRIENVARQVRPDTWLWPDLGTLNDWIERAPPDTADRAGWARDEGHTENVRRHAEIKERCAPGATAEADLIEGELRFLIDGRAVIDKVFVSTDEADLVLAQWRSVARGLTVTDRTRADRLTHDLRRLVTDRRSAAAEQIIALNEEIEAAGRETTALERRQEDLLAHLYGLTPDERRLVAQG
jgi:hypothetical protein